VFLSSPAIFLTLFCNADFAQQNLPFQGPIPMQFPQIFLPENLPCPGLTSAAKDVGRLMEQLPKRLAVFFHKQQRAFLWVVFVGGTGTGKSTIFNALCDRHLSETGVERPKTFGPIGYIHKDTVLEKNFPFPSMEIKRHSPDSPLSTAYAGTTGQLLVLEHDRKELSHLALVDTPDLDSLEVRNRLMVEDLYLLADVVVFVTSEEKYADEVPFQFLERIHEEEKPYFLLLNKAGSLLSREEVMTSLRGQNLTVREDRFRVLPYLPLHPAESLKEDPGFKGFTADIFAMLDRKELHRLIASEKERGIRKLSDQIQLLIELLEKERQAAKAWLEHLEVFFQTTTQNLFDQLEKHFTEESREYLQNEIRRLYSKYDLLGKPRRAVSRVILSPLEMLGLVNVKPQESHQEALERIRRKIDIGPIQMAIEGFNRSVLEKLSPSDETSPLYWKLRDPRLILTSEEIRRQIWAEQERLALWLEQTFTRLAQGIPKSKEWGIYSASILWGGLILSLEVAIGGGISVMQAVLDSAIAPFVTKGAVELFAYHEIQNIARELGKRYQEGLLSVIRLQRDRYVECLQSLTVSDDTMAELHALRNSVKQAS
jgi:GTPase SAR1 family protein